MPVRAAAAAADRPGPGQLYNPRPVCAVIAITLLTTPALGLCLVMWVSSDPWSVSECWLSTVTDVARRLLCPHAANVTQGRQIFLEVMAPNFICVAQ